MVTHVQVSVTNTTAISGRIKIQNAGNTTGNTNRFSMCLSPLYGNITVADFVEYIEVNRLFGADHFFIYVTVSTAEHLIPVITSYQAKGLLTLLQWELSVLTRNKRDIFYFAQTIALNDCLYRSISSSHFMVNTDIDEFIVPQRHNNWLDMMTLNQIPGGNIRSYSFRNIFFSTAAPKDFIFVNNIDLQVKRIKTLDFTSHESKVFPHRARSKYICCSACVTVAGIHYVFEMLPGFTTVVVHTRDGVLQHYRKSPKRRSNQTNRRMHHFADTLIQRIASSSINV